MPNTAIRLSQSNLARLEVPKPSYDRTRVGKSILHIGVGGFHRAHQCVYADDLLERKGASEWGLCGVGLLPHDSKIRDVLKSQDYLYTVVERDLGEDRARIIGSMGGFLYAPEDAEGVLERMASPDCKILSLTITEGGYYVNQGTGEFDDSHPDIRHDLENHHAPRCSFGYVIEALDRRRKRAITPFTVMSCDNLQGNGEVAKKMLTAFAYLRDPELGKWVANEIAFPNSMVDRITPATTEEHRTLVREKFGIEDGWPVTTEPFRQWVIEDHFPDGRPHWEEVGAQMTSDVLPYEKMKMRLLNASHQTMGYIGLLLGYEFAHEAMADPAIRSLVEMTMEEATPILPAVPGIDLGDYKKTLIERFSNPAIKDPLLRLVTDGSARVPKFILPSIREKLAKGGEIKMLSFTVATWFRYLGGQSDEGRELKVIDPLEEKLCRAAREGKEDPRPLLAISELFGSDLPAAGPFVAETSELLRALYERGSRATLARVTGI